MPPDTQTLLSVAPRQSPLVSLPKPYSKCTYSAFISFATLDETGYNRFVSCFRDELMEALPGRLRGIRLTPEHFTGYEPKVAGSLSDELKQAVRESFVMFLFVHDNYIDSRWCLKELEYFKSMFGDEGFLDRLYVIAMSESAIKELTRSENWKRLCPIESQIWLGFFDSVKKDEPVRVYADYRGKRKVAAEEFWTPFTSLLGDLAKKIKDSVGAEPRPPEFPINADLVGADGKSPVTANDVRNPLTLPAGAGIAGPGPVPGPAPELIPAESADEPKVRVYIEANPQQGKQSESLALCIVPWWNGIVDKLHVNPRLYLRATNLEMSDIDQRPLLDDADGVILLWSKKTPDALLAQVTKVEPKLVGPNPAPGLIAYMMHGPNDQPSGRAILNWKVVRFMAGQEGSLSVIPEDAPMLEDFLSSVLVRKRGAALTAPEAACLEPSDVAKG
jgi:hypothetical protein